jgi:hypothetical protein
MKPPEEIRDINWEYCECVTPDEDWDTNNWGDPEQVHGGALHGPNLEGTPDLTMPKELSDEFDRVFHEFKQLRWMIKDSVDMPDSDRVERLIQERIEYWNEVLDAGTSVGMYSKRSTVNPKVAYVGGRLYMMEMPD